MAQARQQQQSFKRTLPASWYTNTALYELERRAVFLKSWYLLGPLPLFYPSNDTGNDSNTSEKQTHHFEIAQIPLTVTATVHPSPSTSTPSTPSSTPSCTTLSNLPPTPTPKITLTVHNTLTATPLTSHVTRTGLLFTTISADCKESFQEFFPGLEELLGTVDFCRRPWRRGIKYQGGFNWKTMIDGYQECLHCQYTHKSFSTLYPPTFYTVFNHRNYSRHVADPSKPSDGLFLHFFPICTLNVYGGGMSLFRVCPLPEPGRTRMEFEYFHVEGGGKFEEYFGFVRQVAMEDFELCEVAQRNLEGGVYREGVLNPVKETGVAHYQQRVLALVTAQHEAERKEVEEAEEAVEKIGSVAKPLEVVG